LVLNHQGKVAINVAAMREFVRTLKSVLRLGGREFTVCFIDDAAMRRLNGEFRGKRRTTDVLSFPWNENSAKRRPAVKSRASSLSGRVSNSLSARRKRSPFLGEIAIAVPTARRNARLEGHTTANEIRWLILHGVLHLLGYDHEKDHGEMRSLELDLREQLRI
jgi:probable rRNA maturation factor